MTLEVKVGLAYVKGTGGATDDLKVGVALYRNGTIQPISSFNGTNGSSQLIIRVFDAGSVSLLATITAVSDLTVATARPNHYFGSKTISGIPGAQVIGWDADINWNDGVNPAETLTISEFLEARL